MTVRRLIGAASAVGVLTAASLLGSTGLAAAQEDEQEVEWVTLSASGSGDEEVPEGTGEDGTRLTASISLATDGRMTYTITVTGNEEEITNAHIYRGAEGENGDVVVDLDAQAVNDGVAAEVELEPDLTERIINNPGNWYINTHSESFQAPTGVARAQLVGEDDADRPDLIDTGNGGQFAAQQTAGPDAVAVTGGALLILAAAGGAYALRRRTGNDNA